MVHRHSGDIVLERESSIHVYELWRVIVSRTAPNSAIPSSAKRYKKTVYGIYGLISLTQCKFLQSSRNPVLTRHGHAAEYLIIITGRELKGQLLGHAVYRAVDFDILPLDPGISASKPSHPVETHLLALVRTHLNSGQFLYSYEFDVTRRLQAQYVAREKDEGKPMWEIVSVTFSKDTTSVSSSALRQMIGFSGISEAGFPESACRASSSLFPTGFYSQDSWIYPSRTSTTM